MPPLKSISVLTTHFGGIEWIQVFLHALLSRTAQERIAEILVIDQNRNDQSVAALQRLDERIQILRYPRSEAHFRVQGHDHAAVLTRAVREAKGEWLVLFDSDCFPVHDRWLQGAERELDGYDALLAREPKRNGLSHPCFMLIPTRHACELSFDDGLFERKIDTGRRIYAQLQARGLRARLLPAYLANGGWWGNLYMGSIYHHGHGSFMHGEDRLSRQGNWAFEYFTNRVMRVGVTRLSALEWIYVFFRHSLESRRRAAGYTARRMLQAFGINPYRI